MGRENREKRTIAIPVGVFHNLFHVSLVKVFPKQYPEVPGVERPGPEVQLGAKFATFKFNPKYPDTDMWIRAKKVKKESLDI